MKRRGVLALLGLGTLSGLACTEESPTSVDGRLAPTSPKTVEVRLAWDDFASGLAVLGGFGSPSELGSAVVAAAFADELDSRTLARFGAYPRSASVRDTAGTTRTDTLLTFVGGRVVAFLDTLTHTNDEPVTLGIGALQQEWHSPTADWTAAIDTIGVARAWSEPGAGPVRPLAESVWSPAEGDSVWFLVDSATVATWADTTDTSRGVRLDLLSPGERLDVRGVAFRLITRASIRPDSLIDVTVPLQDLTFVYAPFPEPPPDGIRIGGAPAWRTVLDIRPPKTLDGPAALCAAVSCPLELTPNRINYAALVVKSRQTVPAFQPRDTVGLDVRAVLRREALPKSPLGGSLIGPAGRFVGPEAFGAGAGQEIEIPVTRFVRGLVDDERSGAAVPIQTLAILSPAEPVAITFASFHGPGGVNAPFLRQILTTSDTVELP